MSNEINESLAWLSSFICDIYFPSESPKQIYDTILKYKNEDINKTLEDFYNEKKEKMIVSRRSFCRTLNRVLLSINKSREKATFKSTNLNDFYKTVEDKEGFLFEKLIYPLYLFTKNLYYKLLKDGAEKVYFLSREGQYMKKMFDYFQEKNIGPKIKTEYLYVSRASTFLGTLEDITKESFDGLFNQYPNLSLENFCKNLSFSAEEIAMLEDESDYNFAIKIENIKQSRAFLELKHNKRFIKLYDEKRKAAKEMFVKYLSQFGDDYKEKLYIVDVGWKGTIQNNIQKILPNTLINGYYLGLMNYAVIKDYNNKFPVLFEHTLIYRTPNCYLYNSNRSIFEMLLAADHGSTKCYEKNENGKIQPVLQNEKLEMQMYIEKIKPIQDNMFRVFSCLVENLNNPFYNRKEVEKIFNRKFFDLIFKPSKEEVLEYKSFYHFENFGVMNYSKFNEKRNKSIINKFKNYLNFRKFIQYDDTWQYLKLYNNGMMLGIAFVYWYKLKIFKKMDIM